MVRTEDKSKNSKAYEGFGRGDEKGLLVNRVFVTSSAEGLVELANHGFAALRKIGLEDRGH
jgi:hypothetical protein